MLVVFTAWVIFVLSTVVFDAVHFLLHRWVGSQFALLRKFASLHLAHHEFLNWEMRIHPEKVRANLIWHVLPEFATSVAFMLPLFMLLPATAVALALGLRTLIFLEVLRVRGQDLNHRPKRRLRGRRSFWFPLSDYHALHHVFPESAYGSFSTVFDLLCGTVTPLRGRRVLLTGANGAFGSAMKQSLERLGAIVETAKSGQDFRAGDYERMRAKLERAEILVLAHGSKYSDCWNANYITFTDLIDRFVELGKTRLVPPEVWACGSEIEILSDVRIRKFRGYVTSKHAFSQRASEYYRSDELTYRHLVISAFTSRMGRGLMSARIAVWGSLFLILRGARYVPVTYVGLAFLNYLPFRLRRDQPVQLPRGRQAA